MKRLRERPRSAYGLAAKRRYRLGNGENARKPNDVAKPAKLDPMKKALLYVVVPLAILVASLWAVPFILPTSQPRPTMTRAERVEAEQAAVHQAAINRLFGSKPADEPTTTMREELAKGSESDLIKGWAGASDEQILAIENEYLAAAIDLIRDVFDEANLDLTLSDDEIRTSIVNALNHEKPIYGPWNVMTFSVKISISISKPYKSLYF